MKVLIIDDEVIIRQGISQVIDWQGSGFELLAPAESAEEAWERIPGERPDILFTDIRMNGRSGLELAKEVKAVYPETEIVILSGYDEFQYAQQAMRDGVSDYLLKTSGPGDIIRTAERLRDKILLKQGQQGTERLLARVLRAPQSVTVEEWQQACLRFPNLNIKADRGEQLQVWTISLNEGEDSLLRRLREAACEALPCESIEENGRLLLILKIMPGAQDAARLLAALARRMKMSCFLASGGLAGDMRSLAASYEQALMAAGYRPLLGTADYIAYERIKDRQGIRTVGSQEEESELIEILKAGCRDRLEDWCARTLERLRSHPEATPESVRTYLRSLSIAGYRWLERVGNVLGRTGAPPVSEPSGFAEGGPVSAPLLLSELLGIMNAYKQLSLDKSAYIDKATAYIREHLDRNLSLNLVSRQVHINANYLSEMFRRETGMTYIEFVSREKVERAAAILKETPLKISEVANQVGYQDIKYFTRLFKKHTGMTPSEYRRNN
ncbi:response regulator [Paenibacillus sp. S150]|uniref:response regulator n=1 Tax=Paenibacillus sp. S150 TaxID=2749826 RepID=UPI001C55FB08|nr:response regulator [Paenibacillus sp. S150]MBW4080162.1 response regulator [Paenibacillus sp. S150]